MLYSLSISLSDYLSVVGDKFDFDVSSTGGELGNSDTGPSGLGVGHQFLVDLHVRVVPLCVARQKFHVDVIQMNVLLMKLERG
jgi:hypothetical protein